MPGSRWPSSAPSACLPPFWPVSSPKRSTSTCPNAPLIRRCLARADLTSAWPQWLRSRRRSRRSHHQFRSLKLSLTLFLPTTTIITLWKTMANWKQLTNSRFIISSLFNFYFYNIFYCYKLLFCFNNFKPILYTFFILFVTFLICKTWL